MASNATPIKSTSGASASATLATNTQGFPSCFVRIDKSTCAVCNEDEDREQCFWCDKCANPFHYSCTELPHYELVKYMRNQYKRKYTCSTCTQKLHPNEIHKLAQIQKRTTSHNQSTETETLRKNLEKCKEDMKEKDKEIERMKIDIDALRKAVRSSKEELKKAEKRVRDLEEESQRVAEGTLTSRDKDSEQQDQQKGRERKGKTRMRAKRLISNK